MGKTINIRKVLKTAISSVETGLSVYYGKAFGGLPEKFVVFTLSSVTHDECLEQHELEVNVVGRGPSTATIEDLADTIWDALGHLVYLGQEDGIGLEVHQESRSPVAEEDETIIRRRLLFTVRVYGG